MLRSKLEDFLDTQWKYARQKTGGQRSYYVSVTPIGLEETTLDVCDPALRELIKEMKCQSQDGKWGRFELGNIIPTLEGVQNEHWRKPGTVRVFRNGHVDFTHVLDERVDLMEGGSFIVGSELEQARPIYPYHLIHKLCGTLWLAKDIQTHVKVVMPMVVQCGLVNMTGVACPEITNGLHNRSAKIYKRDDPDFRIQIQQDADWNPGTLIKMVADRVWNTFNWEHCPFVDSQGRIVK